MLRMVQSSPKPAQRATAVGRPVSRVDAYFQISARGSTVAREVRGGLVTFFTMAYIIALNPLIIGTAPDAAGNLLGGLPYLDGAGNVLGANVDTTITLVAGATALVAGLMTILMGVVGRFPLGLAAGLGLYVFLHLRHVRMLYVWLLKNPREAPPPGTGVPAPRPSGSGARRRCIWWQSRVAPEA